MILYVKGKRVPKNQLVHYALRFTPVPSLYRDGQRVVSNWSIKMDHREPADKYGGNANCAS